MNTDFPQLFMLALALSLDALAASFVYGADNVKIPAASVGIIAGLSTGILFFFLLLGKCFKALIPATAASFICFLVLFTLGLIKLFDSTLKSLIRRSGIGKKQVCFSFSSFNFILTVYADPEKANMEDISVLSPVEALSLGIALSLDSAAAGFGAGMTILHLPAVLLLSFLFTAASVWIGSFLGRRLIQKTQMDLSWLSGVLLLLLAVLKLL